MFISVECVSMLMLPSWFRKGDETLGFKPFLSFVKKSSHKKTRIYTIVFTVTIFNSCTQQIWKDNSCIFFFIKYWHNSSSQPTKATCSSSYWNSLYLQGYNFTSFSQNSFHPSCSEEHYKVSCVDILCFMVCNTTGYFVNNALNGHPVGSCTIQLKVLLVDFLSCCKGHEKQAWEFFSCNNSSGCKTTSKLNKSKL